MTETGKPSEVDNSQPPADATQEQEKASTPPANPTVELSDDQKSYLKGIGIEDVSSGEAIQKIIDNAIKQKSSVSKFSLELEQAKAMLQSQGKPTEVIKPTEEKEEQKPTNPSDEAGQNGSEQRGITENDIFDISRMIATDFEHLSTVAQDGSLFKDMRQLGLFSSTGVSKKEIYDYLSSRNSSAKELAELREFKEKHSQPQENSPSYNPSAGINLKGEMTKDMAQEIVLAHKDSDRFDEATKFLRELV